VAGKPFFVAHGTMDPLLEVERGRAVREALIGLGADVTYREYPIGHQIILPEIEEIAVWMTTHLDMSGEEH
jgi:phospholipase/carboxylesterase